MGVGLGEVIISFMEGKPKMMIKVPSYIEQALLAVLERAKV